MLIKNHHCPKNESEIHYELKQIAKFWLKNRSYNIIGEEINVKRSEYLNKYDQFNEHKKSKFIIDVVGLSLNGCFYTNKPWQPDKSLISIESITYTEPVFKAIGIESKASLSDFKNGFNTSCERTYVIAPKGVIPIKLIPKNIGLIEVDMDNYKIIKGDNGFKFVGVEKVRNANINLDPCFTIRDEPIKNKEYQHFCKDTMRFIAYRYSCDALSKMSEIELLDAEECEDLEY